MKREIVSEFVGKFYLTSLKQERSEAGEADRMLQKTNNSELFSDLEEEQLEVVVGGYFGGLWYHSPVSRYY